MDNLEQDILLIMKEICPDFAPYHALKNDLYKGSLFGGTKLYYKTGENGTKGMVTTKRNVAKYKLDQFPRNFKTSNAINGQPETGWSDIVLLDLLIYLKNFIE